MKTLRSSDLGTVHKTTDDAERCQGQADQGAFFGNSEEKKETNCMAPLLSHARILQKFKLFPTFPLLVVQKGKRGNCDVKQTTERPTKVNTLIKEFRPPESRERIITATDTRVVSRHPILIKPGTPLCNL